MRPLCPAPGCPSSLRVIHEARYAQTRSWYPTPCFGTFPTAITRLPMVCLPFSGPPSGADSTATAGDTGGAAEIDEKAMEGVDAAIAELRKKELRLERNRKQILEPEYLREKGKLLRAKEKLLREKEKMLQSQGPVPSTASGECPPALPHPQLLKRRLP